MKTQILFCDDIRQEITGKHMLIGVYDDQLNMNAGPGILPLAVYLQILGIPEGDHTLHIVAHKHIGNQRTEIAVVDIDVNIAKGNRLVALALPQLPVHVDSDCLVSVNIVVDDDIPLDAGELSIKAEFANRH